MHITLLLTISLLTVSITSTRPPTASDKNVIYSVANSPKGCNECGSPRPRPGNQYD